MFVKSKGILKKVRYQVLSMCMVLVIVCTMLPMAAFAEDASRFSGGTGSVSDPWLISTVGDLNELSLFFNSGEAENYDAENAGIGNCNGYYFQQTTDINLSAVENWEPIGYSGSNYFAGDYNGQNYSISNITCTGKLDAKGYATGGLFGWVAFGSVSNLHIKNGVISATGNKNYSYAGGIAGVAYGSTITNCSVTGSSIESKRTDNNNCAGGISGYATGSVFKNCAATNNTIKSMAYGGGFVGELDDDNGVGTSSFTDCMVANTSATVSSDDSQDVNAVGGFVGEVTASVLTITNCYVYNTQIQIDEKSPTKAKWSGIFAGQLWYGSYASIADKNCYYGSSSPVGNVANASEKTTTEFKDGTVASLLGASFVNSDPYPLLASSPADYTKVNEAVAKIPSDLSIYTDESVKALNDAKDAVVRSKNITEQATVNGYATAIENALKNLIIKSAISITNPESGVKIEYVDGSPFDDDIVLSVTSKPQAEMDKFRDNVNKAAPGFVLSELYDVKLLKNGVPIQPNGKIKVSIPFTDKLKAMNNLQVVDVDDNGNVTIIPSEVIDDKIVFITDHFNYYGMIGKTKVISDNPPKPNNDIPNTGDNSPIVFSFIGVLLSASSILVITRKRKAIK